MSYNGLLSQPSKLMTRVRLPSSALRSSPKWRAFFMPKSLCYKDLSVLRERFLRVFLAVFFTYSFYTLFYTVS